MKLYYTAITAQHLKEHHKEIGVKDLIFDTAYLEHYCFDVVFGLLHCITFGCGGVWEDCTLALIFFKAEESI